MRTKNLLFSTALTFTLANFASFSNEALASTSDINNIQINDVASFPSDFVSYQNGTADDYDFAMQNIGEDGKLTTNYYKINLNPQKFSNFNNNVKWQEVPAAGDDTITIKLPNNQEKYFQYAYEQGDRTKKSNYETIMESNLKIDRDYIGSSNKYSGGGAIRHQGTGTEISGVFIGNSTANSSTQQSGGAIYNDTGASIVSIKGDFIDNHISETAGGHGGAIANSGTIDNIEGNFINNRALASGTPAYRGGAIYNINGTIGNIKGNFVGNKARLGTAIYNDGTIAGNIEGVFLGNEGNSAAIANNKIIQGDIIGDFIANASSKEGGAIKNNDMQQINGGIKGNFIGNSVTTSGSTNAEGGAIYNGYNGTVANGISGRFIDNIARSETGNANGGAVYWYGKMLTITADNEITEFTGNKTISGTEEKYNAIFMKSKNTIDMRVGNNGKIIFNDEIDGSKGYTININSIPDIDEGNAEDPFSTAAVSETNDAPSRQVMINNKINNAASITSNNVTLSLGFSSNPSTGSGKPAQADLEGVALTINSGTLDMVNNAIQEIQTGKFTSAEDVKLKLDADLSSGKSDQIVASSYEAGSKISLDYINILNDGAENSSLTVFGGSNTTNAPEFNLGDFKLSTSNYQYSVTSDKAGILNINREEALDGLRGAISSGKDDDDKLHSMTESETLSGDLGSLVGSSIIITGNEHEIDGNSFAGMTMAQDQEVKFDNIGQVKNFESENGGVVNNDGGTVHVINSSFVNNTAKQGGAIYSTGDVNVEANNKDVLFANNQATDLAQNNAVYLAGGNADLNLKANSGNIRFEDSINGDQPYNVNVSGTTAEYNGTTAETGGVVFANNLENLGALTISSSKVKLADESFINNASVNLDGGHLDLTNGKIGTLNLTDYRGNNGLLSIDVAPSQGVADQLNISGNATGHTRLYVNALDQSKPKDNILFATIGNTPAIDEGNTDDPFGDATFFAAVQRAQNNATFEVWRVAGNPYLWGTAYDPDAQQWFLTTQENTEDPAKNLLTAEMAYYMGLPSAGFEMTRDMLRNVQNKSAANTIAYGCCGFYDENYNGQKLYNAWVSPIYRSLQVRSSADYDADIQGVDGGFDVVQDRHNRTGFFMSYRQGDFDFSGRGDNFVSDSGSDMDIDSYIIGLYHAYTYGRSWLWSGIYGGYQDVKMNTNDGAHAKTDGYQFGGRIAVGTNFNISHRLYLTPMAALNYNLLHYDDFTDNAGKRIKYNNMSSVDAELGARLEKTLDTDAGYAKVYIQPSIIQYLGFNNKVNVSNITPLKTTKDQTLGRMELGGRINLTEQCMIYGNTSYTFGSGYKDTEVKIGINYAF